MDYLRGRRFSGRAEIKFIERGNHEEIMAYIRKYSLGFEAQEAIMERGNEQEMQAIINGDSRDILDDFGSDSGSAFDDDFGY
jgi:hypothetical protein